MCGREVVFLLYWKQTISGTGMLDKSTHTQDLLWPCFRPILKFGRELVMQSFPNWHIAITPLSIIISISVQWIIEGMIPDSHLVATSLGTCTLGVAVVADTTCEVVLPEERETVEKEKQLRSPHYNSNILTVRHFHTRTIYTIWELLSFSRLATYHLNNIMCS